MLVGRSARGKTTLLNKITEKGITSTMPRWGERQQTPQKNGDTPVTVGIAVSNWTYGSRYAAKGKVKRITFKTWDFAGQVSLCYGVVFVHASWNLPALDVDILIGKLVFFDCECVRVVCMCMRVCALIVCA